MNYSKFYPDNHILLREIIKPEIEKAENALENDENFKQSKHPRTKKCRFMCTKCNKKFENSNALIYHVLEKRVPCDKQINENLLLQRQLMKLSEDYHALCVFSESELAEAEYARKHLRKVYFRAMLLSKNLEYNNSVVEIDEFPFDKEKVLEDLKVIIDSCRSGVYV